MPMFNQVMISLQIIPHHSNYQHNHSDPESSASTTHSTKNWAIYKTMVRDTVFSAVKLKTCEDVETATAEFIRNLQHAAKVATPKRIPLSPARNLPSNIKKLVAIKRRTRSKWQKTHSPEDRRIYNNASKKLKAALCELPNATISTYVSSLKREDQSIWKPLKSRKKPRKPIPPIRKNSTPRAPGQSATLKKSTYSLAI